MPVLRRGTGERALLAIEVVVLNPARGGQAPLFVDAAAPTRGPSYVRVNATLLGHPARPARRLVEHRGTAGLAASDRACDVRVGDDVVVTTTRIAGAIREPRGEATWDVRLRPLVRYGFAPSPPGPCARSGSGRRSTTRRA